MTAWFNVGECAWASVLNFWFSGVDEFCGILSSFHWQIFSNGDRCGAKQSGELGTSSEALDGILGFGQANSSMLSQLAAAGKVKKMFAHCLDNVNGGGIFAIGEIVSPKVKTTPMVANRYVALAYLSYCFCAIFILMNWCFY